MVANFFYKGIELEQDAYGSAIFNLPDEVCHDLGLQPGERFDIEADDESAKLRIVNNITPFILRGKIIYSAIIRRSHPSN